MRLRRVMAPKTPKRKIRMMNAKDESQQITKMES